MIAAASSAEESGAWRWLAGGSVDSLVIFLRERGFRVGPSEAIDAARIVLHLARQQPQPEPQSRVEWLAPKLRPVFCKNREDQERFDGLFREWARSGVYVAERRPPTPATPSPPPEAPAGTLPSKKRWRTAVSAFVLMLAVFIAYEIAPPDMAPNTVSAPPTVVPSAVPGTNVEPASAAAPAPAAVRFHGFFPVVRYNHELRPWVGGGLLGLFALGLIGLAIPFAVPWLSHSRRSGRPIALDDSSLRKEAERIVPPLPAEVSARLERHVSGPAVLRDRLQRRPPLHVRRTIDATLRKLGVLQLRYRAARLTPSYLLLVDVVDQQDPRGRMFYHWAQRLQRQGIDVDIRLVRYDETSGTARTVRPENTDWRLNGSDGEPLERLLTPPVGQRLIVVSDGDLLVDKAGRWRDWAVRARFHRWPDRAVFTPVEPRSWGDREEAIERAERSADPGFIILPLDESALAAWAELVVTGRLPDFALSRPQRYPRLIRSLEERGVDDQLLADAPPFARAADLADLVAQLKLYLGENGYYWLCACAVPPIIRWQLTLLLGEQYLINAGVDDDDLPAFIARYYARLASLPWMRRQKMPDWLRLALLDSLPAAIQEELRQVVTGRLGKLKPAAEGQETLQLEEPPGPLGQRRKSVPEAGTPVADTLYLGFMDGHTPRQLIMRAPREWSDWLGRLPPPRRAGFLGDWLAALRDRLLWRNGLNFFGASRRAWAVFALAMALLGGVSVWLVGGNPEQVPAALRTTLYVEQAHAMAFPHRGQVAAAAFSPDGSRVVTAGEDDTARLWDTRTGSPLGSAMRHQGPVHGVALSPDGRRVVTASADRTARLWDAATGSPLAGPMRHEEEVYGAAFSRDGSRVVTASGDRTARLWDAGSSSALGEPMRHEEKVYGAAFSPDGSRVVTASKDHTARLWDARSGSPLGEPMRHAATVNRAAFSADGSRVVTASDDRTARLWDARSGRPLGPAMMGHQGEVLDAAFSADGRRVATASTDKTARLWDAGTGSALAEPMRHGGWVNRASFSPDGSRLLTASDDHSARLWDAGSGSPLGPALRHQGEVFDAAFSADGRRVVTASSDSTARLWDAQPPGTLGQAMLHQARDNSAAFSPDGRRVVTASADKTARLWDADSGSPLGQAMQHRGEVHAAAFSPDGRRVVTASADQTARLWDAGNGSALGEPMRHTGPVSSAIFSPDGRRVVTASADNTARLWDAGSASPLGEAMRLQGPVHKAAFSPDGRRVVTASADNTARLWDAASGSPLGEAMRHQSPVNDAAFSPDGGRVVTASADNTARLWDAGTGSPLGEPMRHEGLVRSASFSPDGRQVVTASADNTAHLWDAGTGSPLGEAMRHDGAVNRAVFSPDGRRVLTASADDTSRLWDAQTGSAVAEPVRHQGGVVDAAFSPDGRRVVTAWGRAAQGSSHSTNPPPAVKQAAPVAPAAPPAARPAVTKKSGALPAAEKSPAPAPAQQALPRYPDKAPNAPEIPANRQPPPATVPADPLPNAPGIRPQQQLPRSTPLSHSPSTRPLVEGLRSLANVISAAWAGGGERATAAPAGGALLWRAPPNPLPISRAATAVSPEHVARLFASAVGVFAVLAALLGWRARRRLVALSTSLETT